MKGWWSFPSKVVLFSFQDFRTTAGSIGSSLELSQPSLILGGDSHTSVWSPNGMGVVPLQGRLMAPSELFVITSSSPAHRRTDALIKFSYHHVPSGLPTEAGNHPQAFWKDQLGSEGHHFPCSLSLFYSLVKSQNEMGKAWKRVLFVLW